MPRTIQRWSPFLRDLVFPGDAVDRPSDRPSDRAEARLAERAGAGERG